MIIFLEKLWFKLTLWSKKRKLDVSQKEDPRNKEFPLETIFEDTPGSIKSKRWKCPIRLNQGPEGMCVAFGIKHWTATEPNKLDQLPTYKDAKELYNKIQKNDRWPGEDYSGTSLEDGLKMLKKEGSISEFRWSYNTKDIIKCIVGFGPLIFVIPTYQGFYYPKIMTGEILPKGKIVGWHCILCNEYDVKNDRIWFVNSWGKKYGKDGRCWMSSKTLDKCFKEGARASFVVG